MISAPGDIRTSIEAIFPDEPIKALGRGYRVRRSHGLSIKSDGVWYDFATQEGGDFAELVRRELHTDWPSTFDWLKSHGWHVDDKKPKPTRQTKPIDPADADFLADIVYGLKVLERLGDIDQLQRDAYRLRRREYLDVTGTHWPCRLGEVHGR